MAGFLRAALLPVLLCGLLAYLRSGAQASIYEEYAEIEGDMKWTNHTTNATYKAVPDVRSVSWV